MSYSGICRKCGCDLVKTGATTAEIERGRCDVCKPPKSASSKTTYRPALLHCSRCDVRISQPADITRGMCSSCHIIEAAGEDILVHGPDGPVRVSVEQHARATRSLEESRRIIAAAAGVPLAPTGGAVQTQRCASCGLRLVQSGSIAAGLCVTCSAQQASATKDDDIPTDDSTCACGTPIKTGTLACSLCAGITTIRELEDSLYISRCQDTNQWRIGRGGTSIVIPNEEYAASRHNKLEALQRWHAEIAALEAAIPVIPATLSPWPRCPAHNEAGRQWIYELARRQGVEVRTDHVLTCLCQW